MKHTLIAAAVLRAARPESAGPRALGQHTTLADPQLMAEDPVGIHRHSDRDVVEPNRVAGHQRGLLDQRAERVVGQHRDRVGCG